MPDHAHSASGARGQIEGAMKSIMDQAITDDFIKPLNQHVIIWEDEEPIATPAEATELGHPARDAGAGSPQSTPPGQTSESGDAVPTFQEVAVRLAGADSSGRIVFDAAPDDVATMAVATEDHSLSVVHIDAEISHAAPADAQSPDGALPGEASAHARDAPGSFGDDAAA